jgi:copper(I)-binding protein
MRSIFLAAIAAALAIGGIVQAQGQQQGDLAVGQAWARATAPEATAGAAYFSITNGGAVPDRLTGVTSPAAGTAQLHQATRTADGIMSMTAMEQGLVVSPGETVTLKPGGVHIMLMGLAQPLKQGETLPLTLTFEKAGTVTIVAKIGGPGAIRPPQD